MSGNTNPEPTVAPDTDNLDDFALLFEGKAKPTEEDAPVEDTSEPDQDTQLDDDPVATEGEVDEGEGEDDATTDDDDPVVEAKPEPKKKPTAKDRIEELNAKYREEERKRIEAEARLRLLEEQEAKRQQPSDNDADTPKTLELPNPNALDEDGLPKYPLGDMDPAYLRDFTKMSIAIEREAIRAEALAEQQAALQRQEEQALLANWNAKVEAAKEEIPDIQEKGVQLSQAFANLEPSYGEFLGRTLLELENGPQVIAYLADNPSEAEAIVAAGAHKAALTLGRLDARMAPHSKSDEPVRKVSSAPKPPTHVNRGAAPRLSIAPDTDNLDDFAKLWNSKK